jgi:hypothetical protein
MKKLSNYSRAFCVESVAFRVGAAIGGTPDIKLRIGVISSGLYSNFYYNDRIDKICSCAR